MVTGKNMWYTQGTMAATPHGNTARLGLTIPREESRTPSSRVQHVITARYPGTCNTCGAEIRPGDSIVWTRHGGVTCAGGHRQSPYGPGKTAESPTP